MLYFKEADISLSIKSGQVNLNRSNCCKDNVSILNPSILNSAFNSAEDSSSSSFEFPRTEKTKVKFSVLSLFATRSRIYSCKPTSCVLSLSFNSISFVLRHSRSFSLYSLFSGVDISNFNGEVLT